MVSLQEVAVLISGTTNFVCDALFFVLELSTFIGWILVDQIVSALDNINEIFKLFKVLLLVLYEDALVFCEDLADKLSYTILFLGSGVSKVAEGLVNVHATVVTGITEVTNWITVIFCNIFSLLQSSGYFAETVVFLILNGFLLIGNSVWLAVTKLPIELFTCLVEVIQQFQNGLRYAVELFQSFNNIIFSAIQNTINSILKIPYSSVIGSIIAILSFGCACKHYRTILSFAFQASLASCNFISSVCYNLWTGHFLERRSVSSHNYNHHSCDRFIEEKLCIVCKEGLKEVMILPCKHVCLCIDCSFYIIRNQKTCPLCRTYIQTTMKVYI